MSWSYDLVPRSSPLSPQYKFDCGDTLKTVKEIQLAAGKEGKEGGVGAESYDRKKAWSSINHSILSACTTIAHAAPFFLGLYSPVTDEQSSYPVSEAGSVFSTPLLCYSFKNLLSACI